MINLLKSLPYLENDIIQDWFNAPNYYPWLNNIAKNFHPKNILEIGVRLGYSAIAFTHGTTAETYTGIDFEENYGSLEKAVANINFSKDHPFEVITYNRNTQELALNFLSKYDFIHIDGDHSKQGALNDILNFWSVLEVGGHMLIDDSIYAPPVFGNRDVYEAIQEAIKKLGTPTPPNYNIMTYRGTWVICK